GLKVPKKSPTRFPIADPQAPAGPNSMEQTIGTAFAGRISVTPGIRGKSLNGIRIAAYSAADRAVSTTIRVSPQVAFSAFIDHTAYRICALLPAVDWE